MALKQEIKLCLFESRKWKSKRVKNEDGSAREGVTISGFDARNNVVSFRTEHPEDYKIFDLGSYKADCAVAVALYGRMYDGKTTWYDWQLEDTDA